MDASNLKALEEVIEKLKEDPSLAYDPKLGFFQDFMKSWGAKPPPVGQKKKEPEPPAPEPEEVEEEEPEEPEEVEEPDADRMPEDPEPYPEKGPEGEIEFTDAQQDKMGEVKQQGAEALEDGDFKKALEKYTEVVKMGNTTAMVYSKRAEILLKLKRPNACIADCSAAIAINPDSGKAFKVRGKAQRFLGRWQEAHKDMSQGQQLDFDDDLVDMQKLVAEKNKKITERQTRIRLREERIAKKRKEADIKARKAAAQKAYAEANAASAGGGFPGMPGGMGGMPGGMPGGMGGMPGGMPGGIDPSMMAGLLNDPDLVQALQNPKMAQAFQDIMSNPANMSKYSDDPEVMAVVQKLMAKMGGAGADLGAMFGGGGHGGGHGHSHGGGGGHDHAGGCCDGGHESGHGDGHGHGGGHGSMPESAGGASVEEID